MSTDITTPVAPTPNDPTEAEMPSVQHILEADTGTPPPAPYREVARRTFGTEPVPVERYTSTDYLRLEYDRLWGRVWQWAANLEDIPQAGDQTVYDIGDRSVLLVRTGPDTVKAYVNACLHRGRQLRTEPGSAAQIRCGFHGWTWNLDGTLSRIPCRWDFPQIRDEDAGLPEVRCETWAGFIFVNFDPDAAPLTDSLDVIPEHFKHFSLEDKFTGAWVQKIIPCNWKISMEAFLESYHTLATHPQALEWLADANTQYDIWATTSRLYTPLAAPSPHLGPTDPEQVYESAMVFFAPGAEQTPPLPEGVSPRDAIAELTRTMLGEMLGVDISGASTAEVIDGVQYWAFPNWCPWASAGGSLQYRFRPYGNDPGMSIFEARMMLPVPPGDHRPPAAPLQTLGEHEKFADVPGLLGFGSIFDQDEVNLRALQRGLRATTQTGVNFSEYHESRIRHFHQLLDQHLAD